MLLSQCSFKMLLNFQAASDFISFKTERKINWLYPESSLDTYKGYKKQFKTNQKCSVENFFDGQSSSCTKKFSSFDSWNWNKITVVWIYKNFFLQMNPNSSRSGCLFKLLCFSCLLLAVDQCHLQMGCASKMWEDLKMLLPTAFSLSL